MTQGAVDARAHQPVRTRTHFFDTLFSQGEHHHSSALHINCIAPMPRPPTQTDARPQVQTVIAVGRKTPHWKTLSAAFPTVRNYVIDVRCAFSREYGEDTSGTGFDEDVRQRIKAKLAWPVVFEIALLVLQTFGLCIVLCNHGKHRSVTVAYEVAKHSAALLVSPRYGNGKLQDASPSYF